MAYTKDHLHIETFFNAYVGSTSNTTLTFNQSFAKNCYAVSFGDTVNQIIPIVVTKNKDNLVFGASGEGRVDVTVIGYN